MSFLILPFFRCFNRLFFSYGIGGFDDRRRLVPIGLENHVKHMLHSSCGQTISGTLLIYFRSLQCPSAEETFTPHKPKSEPKQL